MCGVSNNWGYAIGVWHPVLVIDVRAGLGFMSGSYKELGSGYMTFRVMFGCQTVGGPEYIHCSTPDNCVHGNGNFKIYFSNILYQKKNWFLNCVWSYFLTFNMFTTD